MPSDTELLARLRALERGYDQTKVIERPRSRVHARVANNANITLTSGVNQALTFNTELDDPYGMHDTAVNPSRLTCVVAGWYEIGAMARFASNALGYRQVWLRLNGGAALASDIRNAVATAVTDIPITTQYPLVVGDYVEMMATQTSGLNLDVVFFATLSPAFYIALLP